MKTIFKNLKDINDVIFTENIIEANFSGLKKLFQNNLKEKLNENVNDWQDDVFINYIRFDTNSNKIVGEFIISYTHPIDAFPRIILKYKNYNHLISENETKIISATNYEKIYNFSTENPFDLVAEEEIDFTIEINTLIQSVNSLTNKICAAVVSNSWRPETIAIDKESSIQNLALFDPENKNTALGSPVKIAYGRGVIVGEKVDYVYSYDGKLHIPIKGIAVLNNIFEYKTLESSEVLINSHRGTIRYNNVNPQIEQNSNNFIFEFSEDWNQSIDISKLSAGNDVDLLVRLTFWNKKDRSMHKETITFSSAFTDDTQMKNVYKRIPKVRLSWGCLGKDSLVELYDGSSKKISELTDNDFVKNYKGESKKILQVTKGKEVEIIQIETRNGFRILATKDHPFMTENNQIVRANDLTDKTKILSKNGEFVDVISKFNIDYNDDVYNIKISNDDKGDFFYCDGLVVGDNQAQHNYQIHESIEVPNIESSIIAEFNMLINKKYNFK